MALKLANFVTTTLAASISDSETTLTVATGTGALFPSYAGGDWSPAVIVDAAGNREVVYVTGRSSDTLTVSRGEEGTAAKAWDSGDRIDLRLTKGALAIFGLAADVAAKLPLAGGTMTGDLTLAGAPSANLHAATKQYVDGVAPAQIAAASSTAFADADELAARQNSGGALIRQSWSALKGAVWTALGGLINGATGKTTPVDNDLVAIADSAASNASKKLTLANLFAYVLGKVASAANIRADTNGLIGVNNLWDAAECADLGNISGNTTLDFASFLGHAKAAMTGNVTFNAVSNLKEGQSAVLELTHSGGARTLSLNTTYFSSAGGAGITLSNASGAEDLIGLFVMDNGKVLVTVIALGVE